LLCSVEATFRTSTVTASITRHVFEDDIHIVGDGNQQGHDGEFTLTIATPGLPLIKQLASVISP
jgi:hypothetical protein